MDRETGLNIILKAVTERDNLISYKIIDEEERSECKERFEYVMQDIFFFDNFIAKMDCCSWNNYCLFMTDGVLFNSVHKDRTVLVQKGYHWYDANSKFILYSDILKIERDEFPYDRHYSFFDRFLYLNNGKGLERGLAITTVNAESFVVLTGPDADTWDDHFDYSLALEKILREFKKLQS